MSRLKNQRYERFAQGIFSGQSGHDAGIDAGFAPRSIDVTASRLLRKANIQERIAELFKKTENAAIMSKQELAEMYTRMLKTLHTDFLTMSADGVWFHDIGEETMHQEALKKVKTRIQTEKHGQGESETITAKQFDEIELESKVTIGQALAKLMGYDAHQKVDLTVKSADDLSTDELMKIANGGKT